MLYFKTMFILSVVGTTACLILPSNVIGAIGSIFILGVTYSIVGNNNATTIRQLDHYPELTSRVDNTYRDYYQELFSN